MNPTKRKIKKRDGKGQSFALLRIAVYRRLKAVATFPIIVALGAAVVASALPKRYEAVATIQIDPRQRSQNATATPDATATDATNPYANRPTVETELRDLQSDPVIRDAIASLHLDQDQEFKPFWLTSVVSRLFGARPEADTETAVHDRLSVSRLRNTLLVHIRVSSSDPVKSARVANSIADAYLKDEAADQWSLQSAASIMGQTRGSETTSGAPTPSERVFESLVARYGQSLEVPGPRLVARAEPPERPASPRRSRIVAIAFGLALAAAIAMAIILELRCSARHRATKAAATFACPHMTSLPIIPPEHSLPSRACRFVLAEPAGTYAEAVRSSCRELEKRRGGAPSRLILVVSALTGEGAECLASNIAHQYALAGHASLLIDADLRAKTLTHELARNSARGLLDQIATHQPIENAILRDCATGLHFLPASGPAPIPLAANDILRAKTLSDAIATLKQTFVTIVMTAPPLLTATDATILAELADEIVFATAWQRTPRRLAQKALATIAAHQSKLAGAALTGIVEANQNDSIMSLHDVLEEMRRAAPRAAAKADAA
jgi:Mrp family chromosome partitioning ATPase/capsular polysaccharide biosynthesis protein